MSFDSWVYRIDLPSDDLPTALGAARRIATRCALPPVRIAASGASFSPEAFTRVVAALPPIRVNVAIDFDGGQVGPLVEILEVPHVRPVMISQPDSAFGSRLVFRSGQTDGPVEASISLAFNGDYVGEEAREGARFDRWAYALGEAGVLPAGISPARLVHRFFQRLHGTRREQRTPAFIEDLGDGLRIGSQSLHVGGQPYREGPADMEIFVPFALQPVLARAAPTMIGETPLTFWGHFTADTEVATAFGRLGTCSVDFGTVYLPTDDVLERLLAAASYHDAVVVEWSCAWPGEDAIYNGIVLVASGSEQCDVRLVVSKYANDSQPDELAASLARDAGLTLDDDYEPSPR
jgi:hypothetical protein